MRRLLPVPQNLDDRGFESILQANAENGHTDNGALIDARHVRWADPYGMVGLLALGHHLAVDSPRPVLQLPEAPEVLSYLGRMGFLDLAEDTFEIHGSSGYRRLSGPSTVLLEITPIRSHEDVHTVIDTVKDRAGTILTERLNYSGVDSGLFSMMLSEVCQNIIEHAEVGGWVGIQTYNWSKRLGRQVVVIAVADLGIGFKGSLASEHAARYGDRWSDATALEAAFIHGMTRFRDPGRGQGLKQIRSRVGRWGGKIAIRSGTARISDIPDWDDAPPLEEDLAHFPGTQILIVLPARQ